MSTQLSSTSAESGRPRRCKRRSADLVRWQEWPRWGRAEMETRKIGSLEVTVVGIGCDNFGGRIDEEQTREVLHAAIDVGINFFDTADDYPVTPSGLNTKSE